MISIVLPTYNEKKNISILIPEIEKAFNQRGIKHEILVVDDSSPDGTAQLSRELNKHYRNIRTITRTKKEGIGAALKEGYNNAYGEIILSSDSDLSFEVNDMFKILEKINNGYDLVVGSRHLSSKNYEKDKLMVKIKWLISYTGNKIITAVSGVKIHDFSANFRGIKNEVWKTIQTKEKTNSILYEMIIKSSHKGYKVSEVPIVFKDRRYGKSKLRLSKEAPKFLYKLFTITLAVKLGK